MLKNEFLMLSLSPSNHFSRIQSDAKFLSFTRTSNESKKLFRIKTPPLPTQRSENVARKKVQIKLGELFRHWFFIREGNAGLISWNCHFCCAQLWRHATADSCPTFTAKKTASLELHGAKNNEKSRMYVYYDEQCKIKPKTHKKSHIA